MDMALAVSAPELKMFGYSLASSGSKLAVGLAAIGAVAGIVFGIIDIVNGAKELKGAE
jgi:hypothetical protein